MNEINNFIPDNVKEKIYDDTLHPAAVSFGDILSYFPRTLGVWLQKWKKWVIKKEVDFALFEKELYEKLKDTPEEKLSEPEPYVIIPLIQQYSYSYTNEQLRKMYINLLVSSMNTDKKWDVHPSFVDLIRQLTPDESKLIELFPTNSINILPLIDIMFKTGKGKGDVTFISNFSNIGNDILDCPKNINIYLENLERLKLISIEEIHLLDDSLYEPLENDPHITYFMNNIKSQEGQYLFVKRKSFHVTPYGISFMCSIFDDKKPVDLLQFFGPRS